MTSPILVTGGTGTLGRQVVPLLRDAGREVRVLSRRAREPQDGVEHVVGDVLKGEGIEAALDGAETVLHLAGGNKGDDVAARNLAQAALRADVRHLVLISVIGADSASSGRSSKPSGPSSARACRGRRCAPPSSTTSS